MIHTTFYVRRLHSLCGIVPVGLFLLEHILTNSTVLAGPGAFNEAVGHLAQIPHEILIPMEIVFILIPFLFHGLYGLYIMCQAKNNPRNYGYARNWNFYFQRITAAIIFVFLIWHVVYLRIIVKGGGTPMSFEFLYAYFQNPLVWAAYTIAMIATIFHLCNGLTTFCMTWGITKGPRSQKVVGVMFMALFALLSLLTIAFMCVYL